MTGLYLSYRKKLISPQKKLSQEEIDHFFAEHALSISKFAQNKYKQALKLSKQELIEVKQDALLFTLESLHEVDISRFNLNANNYQNLNLNIKNFILGRINFVIFESFSKHRREKNNIFDLELNTHEHVSPHESSEHLITLKNKMKQLFPSIKDPLKMLNQQEYYLPYLEEDYFKYKSQAEVLNEIENKYNLSPKFKKTLEDEIFTHGRLNLIRLIPFIQKLDISYDGKLKVLQSISLQPKNYELETLSMLLNTFSEPRILTILSEPTQASICEDLRFILEKINQILRAGFDSEICSFSEYLEKYPDVLIRKPKTLKEIHDWLSKIHNNLKISFAQFNKLNSCKNLHGLNILHYTTFVPNTEKDLILVGNAMNICVGSYAENIQTSKSFILILMNNGCPEVCIDLNPQRMLSGDISFREIVYRCNTGVPEKIKNEIQHQLQIHLDNI